MSRGEEQRLQLRFPVSEDEGVTGVLDGRRSKKSVVGVRDLSLGGAGLLVPDVDLLVESRLLLGLAGSDRLLGETAIAPVHLQELRGAAFVGVRFRNQSERFLQDLCRFLVQRHSQVADSPAFLVDPSPFVEQFDGRRIRRLLIHCCRRQRPLRVYASTGLPSGTFLPESLRRGHVVGAMIVDDPGQPPVTEQACYLTLSSFTTLHVLPTRLCRREGQRVAFELGDRILEGGGRRVGRLSPEDGFPVYLEFLHPQVPGKMIRKLAQEVGLGGLRFELNIEDDLLAPGSVIDSAVLRLPDGCSIPCRCIVRHTSRRDGRYSCGVQLTGFRGAGRQLWVQELLSRLNPNVEEATPFNLHEVWDVFERSGYLEEKPVERMEGMRRPFLQTWSKLLGSGDGSRCWVYRDRSTAVGTICTSRIYSNTWLIHHMAVSREVGAARKLMILADLFPRTVFQWLAGVEPGGNVVGYFDADRTFNRSVWLEFFNGQPPTVPHDVQQVHLWDIPLPGVVLPPRWPGLEVRPARQEELERFSRLLLEREGPFVHKAFDLGADRLTLEGMSSTLRRRRHVVVAVGEGKLLGYGMLESASPGVNIFSLYDTSRIIVVDQGRRLGPTVIRNQLFAEIVRTHRTGGGQALLHLAGRGDMPPPAVGDVFEAEAVRTVFSMNIVPAFVAFLNAVFTIN